LRTAGGGSGDLTEGGVDLVEVDAQESFAEAVAVQGAVGDAAADGFAAAG
jgi:hypothetical protein